MISLQPFNIHDFDRLIAWETDEEALMQFAGPSFSFPLTKDQLAAILNDTRRLAYSIHYVPGKIIIGHAEIYFSDETSAHLCRILIGDPQYRGKGWGLETVNQLLHISFARTGIEKATLRVFDINTAAIKCYTRAGFMADADKTTMRRVRDKIWTTLHMCITKTAWQNLQHSVSSSSGIQ